MSRRNSQSTSRATTSKPSSPTSQALTTTSGDVLLVIFIHGFKGTDNTFGEFPERLQHLLTQTIPNVKVECIVFPAYETKGELDKAVVRFADWLTTLTVEREVASGGGAGKARIVLCGHSMGGLLAADSLREFVSSRPDEKSPLWPKIIACLAFDTPYLGLHPNLVKNGVTKATEHVNAVSTIGSALFGSFAGFSAGKAATTTPAPPNAAASSAQQASGWAKWAAPAAYAIGGALVAGAAAGGAYYARDHLNQSYSWLMDHMKYVGNLWDEESLNQRVETLCDIEEKDGVVFRNFYTQLPPSPPDFLNSRTFIVLPRFGMKAVERFVPAQNTIAQDETQGHTGMFSATTNDGYYDLGLSAVKVIQDAYRRTTPRRQSISAAAARSPPSRPSSRTSVRSQRSPRPTNPLGGGQKKKAEEDLISF